MPAVKDYRLYTLDAKGHIAKAEILSLGSDEDALTVAGERAREGKSVEVWHRSQKIASIDPTDPQPLSAEDNRERV